MTKRVAYVVAAILILAQSGPASAAPPSPLESAFASAAVEFSVPQNVLLGVSYVVSRWEADTRPSAAGGYGPMQLLDASTPDAGSIFAGWTGCDTVLDTACTVTMSASRSVTATFNVP